MRDSAHEKLQSLLWHDIPDVRAILVAVVLLFPLYWCMGDCCRFVLQLCLPWVRTF